MLERRRVLRKIEFTLSENGVYDVCHCAYQDQILEDGQVIVTTNHREVEETQRVLSSLNTKQIEKPRIE